MNNIDPEILKRYANHNSTPAEKALVEAWLSEMNVEPNGQLFAGLNKEKLKQEIWHEVKPRQKQLSASAVLKIAACLCLISFFGYLAYDFFSGNGKKILAAYALTYREVVVPKGRTAKVTLTDGTVVNLNADSKLRYPVTFNGGQRTVYLVGEGYFHVAKNAAKPFIIHTAKTNTRVLGTIFNIKAYPEEEITTLTVQEGKVQFTLKSDSTKQLILTTNQQGLLQKNLELLKTSVYAGKYTSWKDSKLNFNEASMDEIAFLLDRQYNVKVENKNRKIANERFTGTYRNDNLQSIATDISSAFHCHYQINNQSLIFY